MAFNVQKCKTMHVGFNNPGYEYSMDGKKLETTEEERDLGVIMSRKLKPGKQCAKAARTAQMVLGQIARAFHFRDKHVFLKLYKTYVRPHLEFAGQAWAPWTAADKDLLENVQRRAVRMVSGLKSANYEDRLRELDITTLEERRRHGRTCFTSTKSSPAGKTSTRVNGSPWPPRRPEQQGQPLTNSM